MPRILITAFSGLPAPNRAGVQLRQVLRSLSAHHTVDVLVVRYGDQAYVERQSAARILRVPVPDDALRSQVDAFRRALKRQLEGADYDVVHFRDGWSGIPVLELREQLKYAAVFDASRSPMAEMPSLDANLAAELARDEEACFIGADLVLVPTERARVYAGARGKPDRVHIAPVGVDIDRFDWDYAPPEGPPIVMFCGTVEPGRGVRVLLRAMVDVCRRTDARLVIVGQVDPEFQDSLVKALVDLGIADRVDFLGRRDHAEIPDLIATSAVCVAPAAPELSPRPTALYPTKILEYMACRRAVVAPRRTTVQMLMKDGVHGLLFAPGNPSDLARKIVRLLADGSLRDRVAASAYELVRREHTASAARRAINRAYRELAAAPKWRNRFLDAQTEPGLTLPNDTMPIDQFEEIDPASLEADPATEIDLSSTTRAVGDITNVERVAQGRERFDSGEWSITPAIEPRPHTESDEWVVTEARVRTVAGGTWPTELRDDEDGTPLDVEPIERNTPPIENKFVAGEVEVPAPGPEVEVEAETVFTAVSVLLGNVEENPPTPASSDAKPPGRSADES